MLTDFAWTWDGDLELSSEGDLLVTSDPFSSILTEIRTALKATPGDWPLHVTIGVGFDDFRGKANTSELGRRIEQRIKNYFSSHNLIPRNAMEVKVTPISPSSLAIFLSIQIESKDNAYTYPNGRVLIALAYDTVEDTVHFTENSPTDKRVN